MFGIFQTRPKFEMVVSIFIVIKVLNTLQNSSIYHVFRVLLRAITQYNEVIFMLSVVLKSKIHRATVREANLDYVGSITVDSCLMEAAGIREYEQVQVVDVNNGNRFITYVIKGDANSGIICLNGAAARKVSVGDKIIIMSYGILEKNDLDYKPKVVLVDDSNSISGVYNYEQEGTLINV